MGNFLGIGLGVGSRRASGGLSFFKSLMSFWSDTFDFTSKTLLDKSGNGNDVPLIGGNCVNFINDVTITLSTAQVGATVTEVNFSETTTGVIVNGSGHIEIAQASLPVTKIYQIKLSTGDEFLLTGGTNVYAFCKPTLYGKLDGTEDTDWEWSTQNDYFGNLQNGFSKEGLLYNVVPDSMLSSAWVFGGTQIAKVDADTVLYTGTTSTADTSFLVSNSRIIGHTYKLKITVWDSTEDFGYPRVALSYWNGVGNTYKDDDDVEIHKNGVHYFTLLYSGSIDRVGILFRSNGYDWSGKTMKFKIEYCKEIDNSVLIPAYSTNDACGNTLTHPALLNSHNGCEVKLNFSGITGITGSDGGAFSTPAAYSFSDTLTNPMFKRLKFNSELKEIESDYIVFTSFINGDTLSSVLSLLEESNMLVKTNSDGYVVVSQKYDASYDVVTIFGEKGYNETFSYVDNVLMPNTNQLPIAHELEDIESVKAVNYFSDVIGPYNITGVGWSGGTHIQPSGTAIQPDWEELTAFNDTLDSVTVADSSFFPDPPSGKKRIIQIKVYSGLYLNAERSSYTKSGNVFSLFPLWRGGAVVLSSVVIGGANPTYAEYAYQTAKQVSKNISQESSSWAAIKNIVIEAISTILDYTQINKADLTGGEMITETVKYYMNQKAPTVFIDYNGEMVTAKTISSYYGLQDNALVAGTNARMYFAHGVDKTLQAISYTDSGARADNLAEKIIYINNVTDNAASENKLLFMDINYGTPSLSEASTPFWFNPSKVYFDMIGSQSKGIGDLITWRGGYNKFKNLAATQYVIAYFQYENGSLYFIVDFTDSLTFGSINEVFSIIGGRKCEVVYKDDSIAIADSPSTPFTIPNLGLDLTATSAGNIKVKIL